MAGHLHEQLELDRLTTNTLKNLSGQIIWSLRRELVIGEDVLACRGLELIPAEYGGPFAFVNLNAFTPK